MTEYVTAWLNGMPTMLRWATPVVRCRDCEHCDEEDYGAWGRVWHCEKFGDVEPDGFCAWPCRKGESE